MEVKKMVEKWKIWNEEEKIAKSEKRQKNWFYKDFTSGFMSLIKKPSERMPTRKL